mgnify:CR=1 FL=1
MKKSYLIHVIWAIVAVVAFVMGSKRIAGDAGVDVDDTGSRSGGRYAGRSVSGEPGGGEQNRMSTRVRRGVSSESSSGRSRKTALSESGIKSIGKLLQTSTDPIERRIAFSRLLEGLTEENAMLMREQLVHMSSSSPEWQEFHYAWGALAGQSSVEFGAESEKRDMAACFSGWVSANPAAALAWFDSQPDDRRERGDLKWGAVYGLANTDTYGATQFVLQRERSGDRQADDMIKIVASSVLRSGDIQDAARWSQELPKGEVQDAAVREVAEDYVSEDPAKAVAWLESLPEGSAQMRGTEVAFSRWASRDAEAAIGRIDRMQVSDLRDSAVRGYTQRIAYRDPSGSIELASTISNPKLRDQTLVRVGRIYMQRDKEAATRWLANSNLAPGLQKSIREFSRRR